MVLASAPNLRHLDQDLATVMRAGESFDWNRVSFILEAGELDTKKMKVKKSGTLDFCHFPFFQAHGRTLDSYVEEHQDRSKNALQKSLEAAYNSWVEELKADQAHLWQIEF